MGEQNYGFKKNKKTKTAFKYQLFCPMIGPIHQYQRQVGLKLLKANFLFGQPSI